MAANPVGLLQAVNINATLPKPMANGTGYRVSVISSSPSVTGSDNGQNIVVDKPELGASKFTTISCANGTANITTLYNTPAYTNVIYSNPTPAVVYAGDYSLIVTNNVGCKDTAIITVMPARIETLASTGGISKGSNRECTDADGWTHYYNNNETPGDFSDDDRLMYIKKNGNDIGTVGMGGSEQFLVSIVSTSGAGNGQGIDVQSPLVGSGDHFISMYRYWDIGAAKQPVTPVTIRFYFHTSDLSDINGSLSSPESPNQLTVYHLPDGNADPSSNWAGATTVDYYQPGAAPSLNTGVYTDLDNGMGQAEFMVSSFSGGGAGALVQSPLPVSFISFTASLIRDGVWLQWSTATEQNSKEFDLQSSLDGNQFETIGVVPASGYSNSPKNYSYSKPIPNSMQGKIIFYRILQLDNDGKQFFSETKSVTIPKYGNVLSLLFNPVKNEVVLQYLSIKNADVVLKIIDHLGRILEIRKVHVLKGMNTIKFSANNFGSGIYKAEVISNEKHSTVTFLKE